MLTLTNSSILSNTAERGAGIHNENGVNLTISNSVFEGNISKGGYSEGGGIYNTHNANVSDSTFKNNIAEDGGGIANVGMGVMTVTNCTFDSNIAAVAGSPPADGNEGGAIWNWSTGSLMTIVDSYFYNNDAYYGGAIANKDSGDVIIVGSEFQMNGHVQSGGAIYNKNQGSVVNISESLIAENNANHGGGIYNRDYGQLFISGTTFYSNTSTWGFGHGGAIHNDSYAKAFITHTTFEGNYSDDGGAIYNETGVEIDVTNSTFSGNVADQSGGAISLGDASTLTATHVTISGNSANDNGGGVYVHDYSVLNLNSSIIEGSLLGGDCYDETYAPVIDLGYNIIEDGTCIYESTSFTADPKLGPLQDNGGETHTQALLDGSPAIDNIPTVSCAVTEDQRGIKRPSGSGCDIGAFELKSSYDIFLPFVVK